MCIQHQLPVCGAHHHALDDRDAPAAPHFKPQHGRRVVNVELLADGPKARLPQVHSALQQPAVADIGWSWGALHVVRRPASEANGRVQQTIVSAHSWVVECIFPDILLLRFHKLQKLAISITEAAKLTVTTLEYLH